MTSMETWTFYLRRLFLFARLSYCLIAVLRLTKSSTPLSAPVLASTQQVSIVVIENVTDIFFPKMGTFGTVWVMAPAIAILIMMTTWCWKHYSPSFSKRVGPLPVVGGGGRGRSSTWSSKEAILRSDTPRKDVMFSDQCKTKLHFKFFWGLLRLHQYLRELRQKTFSDQLTGEALDVLIRENFPPGLRQKLESISAACAVQPIPKRILESKENSHFFFAVDQIDHTLSVKARPGNGRLSWEMRFVAATKLQFGRRYKTALNFHPQRDGVTPKLKLYVASRAFA